MKKFSEWYRSLGVPQSLAAMAKKHRRHASTDKLYVLRMDIEPRPEHAASINASLNPLREKYGIDFIVLGPGIRFEKFDDF